MDRRQPFRYAPERPTTGKVRVVRQPPGTINHDANPVSHYVFEPSAETEGPRKS
jgi:hypothetical protein